MIVLGLNAFGQNPSACLLIDGELKSFSHEERFNRLKCSHNLFPINAVNWCLTSNNIGMSLVDKIAFNWDCNKYPVAVVMNMLKYKLTSGLDFRHRTGNSKSNQARWSYLEYLLHNNPANMTKHIYDALREGGYKGNLPEIVYADHHLCHAYQTFYQSEFREASVLVADGHGEDNCLSGYAVRNGVFTKVLSYKVPYSLGWFYSGFTAYLGFQPNRDEGKLMGLAAYGEAGKDQNPWLRRLDKILSIEPHGFKLDPTFFKLGDTDFHPRYTNKLVDYISSFPESVNPVSYNELSIDNGVMRNKYLQKNYIELAYAVQTRLEEALISVTNEILKQTGITRLCLAGGVFMNCKANRAIYDQTPVTDIFVHPASSDDGSAIGAAFIVARQSGSEVRNILRHAQYGIGFSNEEIQTLIKSFGLTFTAPDDIGEETARLLSQGKILGWFQGRAEMGARALGGRSIIASPVFPDIKDRVNHFVKHREPWRPFCPSMLEENKSEYLTDAIDSPFMIMSATASTTMQLATPSVVHTDNTVRPQTVKKTDLPLWHHLIESVKHDTGHPVILNTSMNLRSEPIANTPADAIRMLYSSGLDGLVMGDFLLLK